MDFETALKIIESESKEQTAERIVELYDCINGSTLTMEQLSKENLQSQYYDNKKDKPYAKTSYNEFLENKILYLLNDVIPMLIKHNKYRLDRIKELEKQINA